LEENVKLTNFDTVSTEIKTSINFIIDQLVIIENAREQISASLKTLKDSYGISPTLGRKVATTMFKNKQEDIEEEYDTISKLIEICSR